MGRTPKINGNGGRDHWTFCYSVVLAGGNSRRPGSRRSDNQAAFVRTSRADPATSAPPFTSAWESIRDAGLRSRAGPSPSRMAASRLAKSWREPVPFEEARVFALPIHCSGERICPRRRCGDRRERLQLRPQALPGDGQGPFQQRDLAEDHRRFSPDASKGNTFHSDAFGRIDEDGLTRFSPGSRRAPRGWYRVAVTVPPATLPRLDPTSTRKKPEVTPIPVRFGNPEKSGLAVEVVENPQPGQYDLTLKQ